MTQIGLQQLQLGPKKSLYPAAKIGPDKPLEVAPRDLVVISDGSSVSSLKRGALNAGSFLLRHGLPMVGAALAGIPGLVVGGVVAGALEYLDRPEQSASRRLSAGLGQALKTSALAAGLGLAGLAFAPLGPALQLGLAGLGTTLAGVLDFSEHRGQQDFQVDLPKFADLYQEKAEAELKKAGKTEGLEGVRSGFALTPKARRAKAQIRLAQMAALTNHHLGPALAVSIAAEIGRNRIDSQALGALQKSALGDTLKAQEMIDGVEVQQVHGLADSRSTLGIAIYDKVMLDSTLVPNSGSAKADFITGHEVSHAKSDDSAATLAQKTLLQSLVDATQLTASPKENEVLVELQNQLAEAILAENRQIEFRADQAGLKHALSLGHSEDQVLDAAREIFGERDDSDTYKPHPSGAKRMAALKQTLEGKAP